MTMTQSMSTKPKMKTELLFDLESTGLLRRGSTIHCIVMRNMADDGEPEVFDYKPERAIIQGINCLLYTSDAADD